MVSQHGVIDKSHTEFSVCQVWRSTALAGYRSRMLQSLTTDCRHRSEGFRQMLTQLRVIHWQQVAMPDQGTLNGLLAEEGLRAYKWSNGPGDVYDAHSHPYHKVIYVARGSITFGLPQRQIQIDLVAGDRLDLPAGESHNAVVGPQGVVCLEAHIQESSNP